VQLTGKPTDPVSLWILNHTEYIPAVGERFVIDGLEVVVEKASRRRIKQVRVRRPGGSAPAPLDSETVETETASAAAPKTSGDSGRDAL